MYFCDSFANATSSSSSSVAVLLNECSTSSNREGYIDRMRKQVDIDVFGVCGHRRCGDQEQCLKIIDQNYE